LYGFFSTRENEYQVNRICPSCSFVATTHTSPGRKWVAWVAWNPVVARSKNASGIPYPLRVVKRAAVVEKEHYLLLEVVAIDLRQPLTGRRVTSTSCSIIRSVNLAPSTSTTRSTDRAKSTACDVELEVVIDALVRALAGEAPENACTSGRPTAHCHRFVRMQTFSNPRRSSAMTRQIQRF
jgi:hypothetical protein